jgi:hypothetical protein
MTLQESAAAAPQGNCGQGAAAPRGDGAQGAAGALLAVPAANRTTGRRRKGASLTPECPAAGEPPPPPPPLPPGGSAAPPQPVAPALVPQPGAVPAGPPVADAGAAERQRRRAQQHAAAPPALHMRAEALEHARAQARAALDQRCTMSLFLSICILTFTLDDRRGGLSHRHQVASRWIVRAVRWTCRMNIDAFSWTIRSCICVTETLGHTGPSL